VRRVRSLEYQFDTFFNAHVHDVRRYTATFVKDERVDDVVQRTFITAWERFADIPDGSERIWLLGVVRNHARNTWRSERRADALAAAIEHARPEVSVELTRNGYAPTEIAPLMDVLRDLNETDCELMVLSGWFEMTPTEIGELFDKPANTIRQQLFRARKIVHERFDDLVEAGELQ